MIDSLKPNVQKQTGSALNIACIILLSLSLWQITKSIRLTRKSWFVLIKLDLLLLGKEILILIELIGFNIVISTLNMKDLPSA